MSDKTNNEAKQAEAGTPKGADVVMLHFSIPQARILPGVNEPSAKSSLLNLQATILLTEAAAIVKGVREYLKTIINLFDTFGSQAGKMKNETDDAYCARTVDYTHANGTKVSIPVSIVFANSVRAMLREMLAGAVGIAKFSEYVLSSKLVKHSDSIGNDEPIIAANGEKYFVDVRAVGLDSNDRLKQFYELTMKAVKAIIEDKDEVRALGICAGLAKLTGVSENQVKGIVQNVVNATAARQMRKQAKAFEEKAIKLTQAEIAERTDAERVRNLRIATNANAGN